MRGRMVAMVLVGLAMLGVAGAGPSSANSKPKKGDKPAPPSERRVLFVGNSLTYSNDMPGMVQKLAKASKEERPLVVGRETVNGFTLQRHWRTGRFEKALAEQPWEVVILQEQSEIPSFSKSQRAQMMVPYATKMHERVKTAGGKTSLLLTWAWREGDRPNNRRDTYEAMQKRLRTGYVDLASSLLVPIIPVGDAWDKAHRERPDLELWSSDQHPNLAGSYLAACVVFGWLYEKSPVGNTFIAGVPKNDARFLQVMAATTLHNWYRLPLGTAPPPDMSRTTPLPRPDSTKGSPKPAKAKVTTAASKRARKVKKEGTGAEANAESAPTFPDGPRVIVPPRRFREK